MDVAYDHIQEETLSPEAPPDKEGNAQKEQQDPEKTRVRATSNDFQTELSEAYKSFSESSWGTALGGFWGDVRKRGETYLETARQELVTASNSAPKGAPDLVNPTGTLSINADEADPSVTQPSSQQNPTNDSPQPTKRDDVPESLPADIVKEAESMFLSFRTTAASRLKKVQKAEDAADEALLKFGANIKDYLRDAVKITAPDGDDAKDGSAGGKGGSSNVLFESKDAEGRRVVHATRFDAQLHVIHCTPATFTKDPESGEYAPWKEEFDVERKTDAIAADLNRYPELRKAMEKLVPEQVEYAEFWRRYYFLRHVVETEEQKRRELLKGTKQLHDEEEVGWGEDEDEEDQKTTPDTPKVDNKNNDAACKSDAPGKEQQEERRPSSNANDQHLKPGNEGRKSNENSVADSDTSYDIISGATSRTPGSPKEEMRKRDMGGEKAEQSDEDDWE